MRTNIKAVKKSNLPNTFDDDCSYILWVETLVDPFQ